MVVMHTITLTFDSPEQAYEVGKQMTIEADRLDTAFAFTASDAPIRDTIKSLRKQGEALMEAQS
jgi:hypothetical protein